MDIFELPDALSRLAQHLEQTDDDPFTLRSRDAVLMAMQVIAERSEVDAAVDQAIRLRYSPGCHAGEFDLPLPVRLRRELVRGLHGCGVPNAERLLQPDDSAERQATPPRGDLLLRLAAHLLPTETSDEAEMDSPPVNLEQFGLGREDPETRILLEHMALGSDDAGWPDFPQAYVVRGLSSYLTAVAKAQRRAVLLDLQPQYVRVDPPRHGPADYRQQPDRPHDRDVEVQRVPRTVYGKPPKCLRCAALGLGHTSPEQIALAVKALGPHTCEEGADRTDEPVKP